MKQKLTDEEKKVIYNSIRYYQMHRTSLNGKEYQICDNLLTNWFDDIHTQQKEQVQ